MILRITGFIALIIGGALISFHIISSQLPLINLIGIPLVFAVYWFFIHAMKKEKSQSKELGKEEVKVKRRDNRDNTIAILCWSLGVFSFFGSFIAGITDADRTTNRYEILAYSLLFLGIILFIIGIVFYIKGERSNKGKQNE
jgi:Ca2+/Na+ antiporter